MIIALSGKGGMGKSTLSALVVRHLVKHVSRPVLAVDADPNSNLGDKLGLSAERTIGDLREDAFKHKHEVPAGTPKQRSMECEVQQAIVEGAGVDLLTMGRGEGPGCYCFVNNLLRTFLQSLSSGYKHVVIDNEAGMEHLSRRTNDKVDLMLVVSDRTPTGLKAARRIADMAADLGVVRGRMGLVVNRVAEDEVLASETIAETGLNLLGSVPDDPLIRDYELRSAPLLDLPDESSAASAVSNILKNSGL